jgi:hypothetical protein
MASETRDPAPPGTIGRLRAAEAGVASYDEVVAGLSRFFPSVEAEEESDESIHGGARYLGRSATGIAKLEVMGDGENVSRVSLVMSMPGDPELTGDHAAEEFTWGIGMSLMVVAVVFPGWRDGTFWVADGLRYLLDVPEGSRELVEEGRHIVMERHSYRLHTTVTLLATGR